MGLQVGDKVFERQHDVWLRDNAITTALLFASKRGIYSSEAIS